MTISALGELIRTKKRDEISKIVSFLSGNFHNHQVLIDELLSLVQLVWFHLDLLDRDVLAISQTCSEWRNYCLEENVFHHHEKETLVIVVEIIIWNTKKSYFWSASSTPPNSSGLPTTITDDGTIIQNLEALKRKFCLKPNWLLVRMIWMKNMKCYRKNMAKKLITLNSSCTSNEGWMLLITRIVSTCFVWFRYCRITHRLWPIGYESSEHSVRTWCVNS